MSNQLTLDELLTKLELEITKAYRAGEFKDVTYRAEAKQQLSAILGSIIDAYGKLESEFHDPGCNNYRGIEHCYCPGREAMLRNNMRLAARQRAKEAGFDLENGDE
jgi:hypothetical protein